MEKRVLRAAMMLMMLLPAVGLAQGERSQQAGEDALGQALEAVGLEQQALGFRPKGYWTRYPDPADIPYKNLAFDDLFADPMRIYDFTTVMAGAAGDHLPGLLQNEDSTDLLKLAFYTGIGHATGQMRPYSASLFDDLPEEEPLLAALRGLYARSGRTWLHHAMGQRADFPRVEEETRAVIEHLDPRVAEALAEGVRHLTEAIRWRELALRDVEMEQALRLWSIRRLGETQFDGLEYDAELEHAAESIDREALYTSAFKLIEAGERLAMRLEELRREAGIDWARQAFSISSPFGQIVLAGPGEDLHDQGGLLLAVDVGGDDRWVGGAGATTSLRNPVSLALDLEGDDVYSNADDELPAQGAAILGAAMLLDISGDDRYTSGRLSQGAAMLGVGVLADLSGEDVYSMKTSGQGAGYFGVGLLIEGSGDDEYTLWGDGQGYGGVGGVGSLVDGAGNDHYFAEPKVSKEVFRPDYHAHEAELNYSYAQGCGVGRRGDITDGHSWAGGMGSILDLAGDDEYISGNWSLGCGYWYGMGIAWDGGGDDLYDAGAWSMGSGAHFAIGAQFDESGNDHYELWHPRSYGLAFGHDYVIALFADKAGDDVYRVQGDGFGWAINMSQAFFFDLSGQDRYVCGGEHHHFGQTNYTQNNPPAPAANYHLYSDQVSLFLDLNGEDEYLLQPYPDGEMVPYPSFGEDRQRLHPAQEVRDALANPRHYGLGWDMDGGAAVEALRWKLAR